MIERACTTEPGLQASVFLFRHVGGCDASRRADEERQKKNCMRLEVVLSPLLYESRRLKAGHVTVAVDVLRATSAICAAFKAGADAVLPLASLEALPDMARRGFVVCAEREGKKMPGARLGNSPLEYLSCDLRGSTLAFSTTNGTVAILRARDSEQLVVGAFANLDALTSRLSAEARDVVVLCSGWKGAPSIEDTLLAGALYDGLQRRGRCEPVDDATLMAHTLWLSARADLYAFCQRATHVQRLQRLGYDADVRWALQADTCPVVPYYRSQTEMLHVV